MALLNFGRAQKIFHHVALMQRGFTLIELLISTSIILLIGGQVFVSFSGLNEASTLDRAAQELAFNIRRAQNMALSIAAVNINGTYQIPRSVALQISSRDKKNDPPPKHTADSGMYLFFADQNGNQEFDYPDEQIQPEIMLPGNIQITSISGIIPGNPEANLIFYTPEATLLVSRFNGNAINANPVLIVLQASSGATRTIKLRSSGQVTVSR